METRYCISCLATDVKMHDFDTSWDISIGEIYSQMMDKPEVINESHNMCFECSGYLHNYYQFLTKCLNAQRALSDMKVLHSGVISQQTIENIDRKLYSLESKLKINNILTTSLAASLNSEDNYTNLYEEEFKTENVLIKVEQEPLTKYEDTSYDEIYIDDEKLDYSSDETLSTKAKRKHIIKPKDVRSRKIKSVVKTNDKELSKVNTYEDIELPMAGGIQAEVEKIDILSCNEIDENNKSYSYSSNEVLATSTKQEVQSITASTTVKKKTKDRKKINMELIKFFEGHFTIAQLTLEEAKQELLLRKETESYKKLEFKCEMCYKGYDVKESFDKHMERHDARAGKYECNLCHLRFPGVKNLRKHMLTCHQRKYSCVLCPYVCCGVNQAKDHLNRHQGKTFTCEDCNETFTKKSTLKAHATTTHFKSAEEVCDLCGNTFVSAIGVNLHKKLIHTQESNTKEGPECQECGVHFTSEAAWGRHLATSSKHNGGKHRAVRGGGEAGPAGAFGCRWCGAVLGGPAELRAHRRAHRRPAHELPANCTECGKLLTKVREFKSHMMTEHPESHEAQRYFKIQNRRSYICEVCGKTFKAACFLKLHMRLHTGEKPHKCNVCGKSFRLVSQLTVHTNLHTKEKLYSCETCGRDFLQRSVYDKHVKVHLGIRPHKCTVCGKGFLHLCELKQHIKYTHEKVPWPKRKRKTNVKRSELE